MNTKDYKDRAVPPRPAKAPESKLPGISWFISGIALGFVLIGLAWSTLGPTFIWNAINGGGDQVAPEKPKSTDVTPPEAVKKPPVEKPQASFSFSFPKTLQEQKVEIPKENPESSIKPTQPPPALAPAPVVEEPEPVIEPQAASEDVTEPDVEPQPTRSSSAKKTAKRKKQDKDRQTVSTQASRNTVEDKPKFTAKKSYRGESKRDSKPESKRDSRPESRRDSKPESRRDSKPEYRRDSKPESKKNKADYKPKAKVAAKSATTKSSTNKPKPQNTDTTKDTEVPVKSKKPVSSDSKARKAATGTNADKSETKPKPRSLQIGAFQNPDDVRRMRARMALLGVETEVEVAKTKNNKTVHRVRTNAYKSPGDLEETRKLLNQNKVKNFEVGSN